MAEMPVLHMKFDGDGLDLLARLIAQLQCKNETLSQALTAVQAVSTQQVERIRTLEAELAKAKNT